MADKILPGTPGHGQSLPMKYVDNGDGSFSPQVAASVTASGSDLHTQAKGTTAAGYPTSTNTDANTQALDVYVRGGGAGGGAVTVADGADVAQGTTTDASSASTVIGLLKAIKAAVQGTLGISGTVTSNIGTTNGLALDATLTGGTQKSKLVDTGGTNVASVSAAGALKVDGSAVTQPVSITGNQAVNVAQVAGTATDTNSGNKSAGTQRVVLATDQPQLTNALKVDGSAVTQPVSLQSVATSIVEKADVVAAVTAAWTSATGVDTTLSIATLAYSTALLTINPTSTFTGGAIIFEVSDDAGTTWYPIQGARLDSFTVEGSYTIAANTKRIWQFDVAGTTNFRVRLNPVITGTGTLNIRLQVTAACSEPAVAVGGTVAVSSVSGTVAENVTQLAGTAVDVNSGTKSAGTLRVVLATDQPQLTNKLLVTPDANSAVNVAQVAGTATDVNSGNKSAGTQRVVLATDQPALTNALKVDGSAVTQPVSGTVTANMATGGGKTLVFATVSTASSGQTAIVAADGTRKIKVVSYVLVADAAVTAKWQNASTDISGAMSFAANGGVSAIGSVDSHLMETSVNQALNINLGSAVGIRGHISYFLE